MLPCPTTPFSRSYALSEVVWGGPPLSECHKNPARGPSRLRDGGIAAALDDETRRRTNPGRLPTSPDVNRSVRSTPLSGVKFASAMLERLVMSGTLISTLDL
jgi:hypothetical protein